jgi:transposase
MSKQAEYFVRIDRLASIFNRRYQIALTTRRLTKTVRHLEIAIHKRKSKSPNGGRPANTIMAEDVPRLEAYIKSQLKVTVDQGKAAIQRLLDQNLSQAKIAQRSDIDETSLSLFANGIRTMNRDQLAKIKQVESEPGS